jgi:hypothetical protein
MKNRRLAKHFFYWSTYLSLAKQSLYDRNVLEEAIQAYFSSTMLCGDIMQLMLVQTN